MEVYSTYTTVKKIAFSRPIISLIICLSLGVFFTSCKGKLKKKKILADESVYSNENFNDLTVDSLEINNFFKINQTDDSIKSEVSEFYAHRSFQFAWLNKKGLTNAAPDFYSQLKNFSNDFEDNSLKNRVLDTPI